MLKQGKLKEFDKRFNEYCEGDSEPEMDETSTVDDKAYIQYLSNRLMETLDDLEEYRGAGIDNLS
jgi:hypothetical protein